MKKRLIIFLTFIILICTFGLTACKNEGGHKCHNGICSCGKIDYSYVTEGLDFELINGETEYQVKSYFGTEPNLVIPNIYNNKPVTTIKQKAFEGCAAINSVAISNSVKIIEDNAFFSCKSLTTVIFQENSKLTSIGDYAFSICANLESIQIPNSVRNIGTYVFRGCSSLKYNVKDGGKYLGNSINPYIYLEEKVGKNITEISIDSNCKFVGIYAFSDCTRLTSAVVPNSVEIMHSNVFYNCPSLTIYCESLVQPTSWDSSWNASNNPVIWDCNNNTMAEDGYVYTTINGINYGVRDNEAVVAKQLNTLSEANIPSTITYKGKEYNVTSISDEAFADCKSLRTVVIPDSIIRVGKNAFNGCNYLTYITSNGFKYLGNSNNPHLYLLDVTNTEITSAIISNNCKIIGYEAFADCALLATIKIPDSVTNIGYKAFSNCSSLTDIQMPNSLVYLGDKAFNGCTKIKYNRYTIVKSSVIYSCYTIWNSYCCQ